MINLYYVGFYKWNVNKIRCRPGLGFFMRIRIVATKIPPRMGLWLNEISGYRNTTVAYEYCYITMRSCSAVGAVSL